jgi:hypothetical protein
VPKQSLGQNSVPKQELGNEEKVLGGTGILPVVRTGWKPVPPKAAGAEARPTNLFIVSGVSLEHGFLLGEEITILIYSIYNFGNIII